MLVTFLIKEIVVHELEPAPGNWTTCEGLVDTFPLLIDSNIEMRE